MLFTGNAKALQFSRC